MRNSDYQSDYAFYASVIRDEPLSHIGYYGLGNWFERHGRLHEAEAAFMVAIERAPEVGSLYNNLAVVLMTSQRLHEAEAVLGRGIEVAPRAPRLFYNRGTVRMGLRRFDDAERDLLRALELDPGYRKARQRLHELRSSLQLRRK
jgi:anaphase-promoting complex subunit 3